MKLIPFDYNNTFDRDGYNSTAKYWAQAYAGAIDLDGSAVKRSAANMAGLDPVFVKKFADMGFPEKDVVSAI